MRVSDWDKWTSAKKKLSAILITSGIFFSLGIEKSALCGKLGVLFAILSFLVMRTIKADEW